ncbi:DUF1501 domain-containing protein [Paraburkholderia lycopersici]|uniref:Uncharacterized conserved protein, DUF1501 family n=1 Tax=Paraburkholderia lycopersici TaxID=416944 RepID=A0A1G6HS60_9BURK|nr:DUF1501 domain-containing protein [Paraburkholderia lycopersici]SDB96326.1 Uncharacterized conserved protein, DUF1501 family [Paraburkholderia lycopersici]
MKRRDFLAAGATAAAAMAGAALSLPGSARAQGTALVGQFTGQLVGHDTHDTAPGYENLLILVELKGGNDSLNTVVPFADPLYNRYRPNIAVPRARAVQLDERTALHPSLAPLMSMWRARELAIVQGVGYAQPNRSHFRSIEIWDTASRSDQYLREGWLTRAFASQPVPRGFAADALVLGSAEMGPLANGACTIALANPAPFASDSPFGASVLLRERNLALAGVVDVESGNGCAANALRPRAGALKTSFAPGAFGASIKTAMQALASAGTPKGVPALGRGGVAAIRLTLNGFDTHENQPQRHADLLHQFAAGMVALRAALVELGRWNRTLIVTYAEFGRRVRENPSRGTDHGAASAHFVAGGGVAGGLYGQAPQLARLDGNGDLPVSVDFRRIYATVLGPWWGLDARAVLQQRFEPLPLLRA